VVYCDTDGIVPVPDDQLPIVLPDEFDYNFPGSNPLLGNVDFVNTTCPKCGKPARRETDTMDTFVDSAWYWWRYLSPDKEDGPIDPEREAHWCPVDQYTGGGEHAVMHLLYARFITKAFNDMGIVKEREPWLRLFNQGQILGEDGERMSKSRGNVQDPDELVDKYGADTVRLFLMFMGPWDQGGPWNSQGIEGVHRFLRRVWAIATDPESREHADGMAGRPTADELRRATHRTIKKVTEDHATFHWNTMISALMELTNTLTRVRGTSVARSAEWDEAVSSLILMLAPLAPHFAEELWSRRLAAAGEGWHSVHTESWPEFVPELVTSDEVELPIQVNGRLRDVVTIPAGLSEIEIEQIVMARDKVRGYVEGNEVVRVVQVAGRLVNVVTRPRA
jgi:leucyl-tRNA synthetase